jgi:nucleotide-binding universal stress UspA family protein
MHEYNRILALVDFDDTRVARRAINLARAMGAELSFLHLIPPDPSLDGGYPPPSRAELARGFETAAQRRLAFLSSSLDAENTTLLCRYGPPEQAFAECLADWRPDLVVADADPGYLGGRHDLLLLGQASGGGWLKRLLNQILAPVLAPG